MQATPSLVNQTGVNVYVRMIYDGAKKGCIKQAAWGQLLQLSGQLQHEVLCISRQLLLLEFDRFGALQPIGGNMGSFK